ncbi:MAG TPA: response regulator [Acidimicrobiales bacterium]|nr:response regulator [Acidimicrobiales bacterium]
MHALVVDDSRSMRSILGRILKSIGVEVDEAADGADALAQVDAGMVPDVALVDWHMPAMNGVELVAELRQRPELEHMSIMMVTTEGEPEQIGVALEAGANEYLIKPFTADAVVQKLTLLGKWPLGHDTTDQPKAGAQ